jgi:hypothetical protein
MTLALPWSHHGPCALTTAMMMQDSGRWPWRHGAAVIAARRMAAGGACGPPRVVRERWSSRRRSSRPARALAQGGQEQWTRMCCDGANICAGCQPWRGITSAELTCAGWSSRDGCSPALYSSWWPLVRCPVKRVRSCWMLFGRGSSRRTPSGRRICVRRRWLGLFVRACRRTWCGWRGDILRVRPVEMGQASLRRGITRDVRVRWSD